MEGGTARSAKHRWAVLVTAIVQYSTVQDNLVCRFTRALAAVRLLSSLMQNKTNPNLDLFVRESGRATGQERARR